MNEESIFLSAAQMLKTNGKLMMTYRPENIVIPDHELNIVRMHCFSEQGNVRRGFNTKVLQKRLENSGFRNPIMEGFRTSIRQNGFQYYHMVAYKK